MAWRIAGAAVQFAASALLKENLCRTPWLHSQATRVRRALAAMKALVALSLLLLVCSVRAQEVRTSWCAWHPSFTGMLGPAEDPAEAVSPGTRLL